MCLSTANKRIIETPMSPETVAWDNPFPTFPMRPKKGAHSTAKSLDGSVAETNFRDQHRRDKNHDDRPQTASSKSSSNTIPQSQSTNESIYHSQNQNEGYFDRNARAQRDAHVDQPVGQGRPVPREPIHTGGGNNELKPPGVSGRHSEDNRTRPSIPIDPSPDSRFQRSRTMPTAIAEAALKPNSRPKPAIQTSWQEPGPVAGYHGPDDRGYTPTSPLGPIDPSQQRPYGQSRAISAEKRPYGHAAVQNPTLNSRQAHAPQDSFGDVLDGYYDRPAQQDHPSYSKTDHGHYRPTGDEEMPNFDAQPDPGATHRRGMTIDKHLQQPRSREQHPPVPDQLNQRSDMYINGPVPRSRSQPDLKDRRSPRQQHNDGFDFGVPGPSTRPPATAPARDDCGLGNAMPPPFTNPNDWPVHSKQYPMEQRPGGPAYTAGYRHDDWNVPPPRSGPPARGYQANAPPDRFRSPPQEGRPNGPSPMGYRDQHRPDRLRSPPLQGGPSRQGPTRPPNASPPPSNEHTVDGSLPVERQNNGRSPPIQDDRSRHGQMRPPGGGPSPNGRPGPSSTPPRSPINPDALPAHPAPVRAGLMEGSPVNQAAKPAPVRQYNATPSPMQLSDPSQKPGSSNSAESKRESVPVTHQELDRLKQATARNPNDMATQLILAKKLVEAAGVLVDERADSRTRSKSREKYILDAYKIVKKLSGNGYTGATFYLADCYTRGSMGLESDTREAFKLYQNAAKAGHPQAAYRVAVCCEIGQEEGGGTSRDPVKAMQWYKRAATLGDTPAMYKMGIVSLKGLLGQPKNPREAITWLKRAAERADQENPHALHELVSITSKSRPVQ